MTRRSRGTSRRRARFTTSIAGARSISTSTTPDTSSRGRLQDAGAAVDLTDVIEEAKGARAEISAAHPVSGHFAPPRRGHQPGVSQLHRGIQLPGPDIAACFPSRSTSCAKWWRKFSTRASRSISAWKSAASRNCSPGWRCKTSRAASSFATATRTRSSSRWRCWASSWAKRSSWWSRNWRNCGRSSPFQSSSASSR